MLGFDAIAESPNSDAPTGVDPQVLLAALVVSNKKQKTYTRR